MSEELTVIPAGALAAHQPAPALSLEQAWQDIKSGDFDKEKLAVMKELIEMHTERQYASAIGRLQAECENVIATKDVDGKFRYAPFLPMWNAVRPAVERNNFTIQWSQEHKGATIKVVLTLQHSPSGHKRDFPYELRIGSNAPGTPQGAQAPTLDEISEARAKRRALMNALNIVVDTTPTAEDVGDGSLASQEEVDGLFKRLVVLEPEDAKRAVSERRFLALAGVDKWTMIPKNVIPVLQRLMTEKEKAAARKGAA